VAIKEATKIENYVKAMNETNIHIVTNKLTLKLKPLD